VDDLLGRSTPLITMRFHLCRRHEQRARCGAQPPVAILMMASTGGDMFRRGRSSWRFAIDVSELLHAALFVRDAVRLPVAGGTDIPPRLEGDVPDLASRLAPEVRGEAAGAWSVWWETLLELELRKDRIAGDRDQMGDFHRHMSQTVDAPDWSSLDNRPALQAAVRLAFADGARWAGSALEPLKMPDQKRPTFRWAWVRDGAKHVAGDHAVGIGDVHGSAKVLLVEGSWWVVPRPGVVLCSVLAAEEENIARQILRDVFESAVREDH
jgi:hypothetical protein